MKMAKEVEAIKVQQKVPHSEARALVYHQPGTTGSSSAAMHGKASYSQVLVGNGSVAQQTPHHRAAGSTQCNCNHIKASASIATQTMEDKHDEKFFVNLRIFVIEILSMNFTKENKATKVGLADSAIRNHFGINLRKSNTEEPILSSTPHKRKINESPSTEESDVLSNDDSPDNTWQTVEKKQVRVKDPKKKKKCNKYQR